jgi:hypothetical protein
MRVLAGSAALAATAPVLATVGAGVADADAPPIVKPTPDNLFYLDGTNAETRPGSCTSDDS